MSEDTIFTLPQLPDGVKTASVPVANAPSTSFVMIRGLKGVTTYMRQRMRINTESGPKLFSKNLARWHEGTAPTVSELESLISISRCNYIILHNGVDPKSPGLRIPDWMPNITNLNYELTDRDCLFPGAGERTGDAPAADPGLTLKDQSGTACDAGRLAASLSARPSCETVQAGQWCLQGLCQAQNCAPGAITDCLRCAEADPAAHLPDAEKSFSDADVAADPCQPALISSFPARSRVSSSDAQAEPSSPVSPLYFTTASGSQFCQSYIVEHMELFAGPCAVWTVGAVAGNGGDSAVQNLATMNLTVSVNGIRMVNAASLADWRYSSGAGSRSGDGHRGSRGSDSSSDIPPSCQEGGSLPSFEQICNEYMECPQLKENTIKLYRGIIRRVLAPRFEDFRDLRNLTAASAARLILIPLIREDKISTAHTTRSLLNAIVRQAQRVHDLSSLDNLNQIKHMGKIAKLSPIGDTEKPFAAMITGDIGENIGMIFNCFQQTGKSMKIRALLELSFHLCLRQSEICRIRVQDVNFDEHRLHIGWTKTITAKSGGFDIPLNETTEALFRKIIEIRTQEIAFSGENATARSSDCKVVKGEETKKEVSKSEASDNGKLLKGSSTGSGAGSASGSGLGAEDGSRPEVDPNQSSAHNQSTLDGNTFLFATRNRKGQGNGDPQQHQSANTLSTYIRKIPELKGHQTAHGIRALFRTWASRNGIDNDQAECVLSHKCWNRVKLAYNRDLRNYLYDQRKNVMKQWSDFIVSKVGESSILMGKREN